MRLERPVRPPYQALMQRLVLEDKLAIFKLIGYEPHPGQVDVHASSDRFRVVCCGRRWGKSKLAAAEAVVCAVLGGGAWAVAPDYDLSSVVFDECVAYVAASPAISTLLLGEPRVARGRQLMMFRSGGFIAGKSSHKPQSLLGRGLDLVIEDEAAVEDNDAVFPQFIRPVLADREGSSLAISTPRGDNHFKDRYERGTVKDRGYRSWHQPSGSNPLLRPGEIEDLAADLPADFYRQEILAEFLDAVGALFRGWQRVATVQEFLDGPLPGRNYVAGVDFGRYQDFTVITVADHDGTIVYVDRFNNLDWDTQEDRIVRVVEKFNCPLVVDSTGIGDRILEALRKKITWVPIDGFIFSNLSKTNLMRQLALAIEQDSVALPCKELTGEADMRGLGAIIAREMSAYRYERAPSGSLKMGAPPGRHDDIPTSLALCVEALRRYAGMTFVSLVKRAVEAMTERDDDRPSIGGTFVASAPAAQKKGQRIRRVRGGL